jgi:uncharacterized membrane protein YqiK
VTTTLIVVAAAAVLVPLVLAILSKVLWKVPSADEALIVTGLGIKGRAVGDRIFKIVTGGGAFVFPVLHKAQQSAISAHAGPLADAEARKRVVVQETAVAELEAERVARISIAEAQAREVERAAPAKAKQIEQIGNSEARITTARGIADGEATKAEGASIRAKGLAEAEAIAKRAEALEKEADAVIGQQIAEQLPDVGRAGGWVPVHKHVDNLTVLNGAQGISEIIAQVIGQAGPALEMAQGALARTRNGASVETQ